MQIEKNKNDTEEDHWTDSSKNNKHVNRIKKSDCVSLQAEKQRHFFACNQFKCACESKKKSRMSEENCKFNMHIIIILCSADIWNTHYNKHKQSENNYWKIDKR